ncbi:hypothetical protein DOTSEDRAFT_67915 [Dothistroma septosporum NZE10]|uniref:Transcription regulator Rua1 C-terminal domain-containing protein n=1 Tax=Dothistroma septosporum (strain NZE10 / CBS 128990) TaxID=675120 RepID=N1Q027_DOTSN|nr:hypothetical protein DOTSEDRAFT_67915 [Dothistroma septosporum NZE10]
MSMYPPSENATSEGWGDWYGVVNIDGYYTPLHVPDSQTFYNDSELQLPLHLLSGSFGTYTSVEDADHASLQPSSGYGYAGPHVARRDSEMLRPASLTSLDAGSPPMPHASNTFGSCFDYNEASDTASWGSCGPHPQQALQHSHLGATRRASGLVSAPIPPDAALEPVSPTSTLLGSMKRTDPPLRQTTTGIMPHRQNPKSASDEYTARWIKGNGTDRAGWCGLCSSWHKLKDSAYWYHMHYTHGISCTTGKRFDEPIATRQACGAVDCEVLCGSCRQWIYIGRSDKWRTPYYRHAYRCQAKNNIVGHSARSRPKSTSPQRSKSKQT